MAGGILKNALLKSKCIIFSISPSIKVVFPSIKVNHAKPLGKLMLTYDDDCLIFFKANANTFLSVNVKLTVQSCSWVH